MSGIHARDHGGVNRHLGTLKALLFRCERGPGNRASNFAGADFGEELDDAGA